MGHGIHTRSAHRCEGQTWRTKRSGKNMFAFTIRRGVGSPSLVALRRIVPSIRYESSSAPATSAAAVKTVTEDPEKMKLLKQFESDEMLAMTKRNQQRMAHFEECREIFYGPERDFENFPTPKQREYPPPMKLKIVPQRWLDLMYNKTGVSGPYVLAGAFSTYLVSKELLMHDPHFMELVGALGILGYLSTTNLFTRFGKYLDGIGEEHQDVMYTGPIRKAKEFTELTIDQYKKEITYMKEEDFVDQVYEEKLGLMLEAEYRRRMSEVHREVKRRLDYQLDLQNAKRRFEQEHMVKWITDGVLKSVTPQLEKESIKNCIATLNSLAKTAKAV